MDLMTILGFILGGCAVYIVLARGQIAYLLFNIDALILVLGGTIASTFIAYPWATLKEIPKAFKLAFFPRRRENAIETIEILVGLCEKSKRSGIQSISSDIKNTRSKFLVNSIKMLIDGFELEIVRDYMEKEIIYMQQRHQKVASVFRMMATVAPIFGLLGTLIGVVQVLRNITDPIKMGSSMAIAVVTTFYGIFLANFFCLPVAVKLSEYSEDEIINMQLVSEGISSIQKGDVPLVTEKKLESFLSAKLRERQIQK